MKIPMRVVRGSLLFTILFAGAVPSVLALGFRNPDQNAAATAQGEAFVAQADNASAIYYNPAGLTQIKGTEVSGGGSVITRDWQFDGKGANKDTGMSDPAYSLQGFGASNFGLTNWTFGLGGYIPFGNSVDWGNNTSFKYQLTESSLKVMDYAAAVAYQFNDHLSLGAVFNFYDGDVDQQRLVPFSLMSGGLLPDGKFKFEGGGQAFGATVGAMYKLNEHHSFGAVYRSPFAIDFHGHAGVHGDTTGLYGRAPATAEIQFPQSVAVGYAFRPIPKLKLETDFEWTDWDSLNKVKLHSSNPNLATTIPFDWKSSVFVEVGAQYELDEHWTVRGGYIWSENTVPSSTFAPSLPDANRNVFSAGVGYKIKKFQIDFTYQYSISDDRKITKSNDSNFDGTGDLNGTWKSQSSQFMLTSTYKF